MFLLTAYLYDHYKSIITGILILTVLGCKNQLNPGVGVSPKNFNIQIPFILSGRGIIINTYWGVEKKHHVLCLDNYSPSWIKSQRIKYDRSFVRYSNNDFHTSTADGTTIKGEIGICDSLTFGNITFINAPFYVMPYNAKDNVNDDGVFGSELMSKGIWKIDFKNNLLTFTSSIDSLPGIRQAEIFPSFFNEHSIMVDVRFGNNAVKRMAIDLGFDGNFIVPLDEFSKISTPGKSFPGRPGLVHRPALKLSIIC